MPEGYQPPKIQQFDGKGNLKQHIAHFIKTCNEAGTYDCWEQLEQEFNRFYSTRRVVSMIELTKARQGEDELAVDFINHWRGLILKCKDRLSETSNIEMCIKGMNWGLHYILQRLKPNTFKELATHAHDMELSLTLREDQRSHVYEPYEDEDIEELQSGGKSTSENDFEESMYI
ncbi:hypothetical protein KY290_001127 [Solanum tuberosum]|uniref:Retrotransposon gag domain-containing protein n=1 Tax=Solanum tuberosum TaxID=4113 RepID=A0ABQ7WNA1_SOLTU|nr:hypothetical protein KY290_001127 [Solanum tuberosum]